jgi:hypothetical protein
MRRIAKLSVKQRSCLLRCIRTRFGMKQPFRECGLGLGCRPVRSIEDRPKPKMRGAEVDLLRLPRGRTIARAVVGCAQIRAALDDAAR